jgi:hypothetical protein
MENSKEITKQGYKIIGYDGYLKIEGDGELTQYQKDLCACGFRGELIKI